MNFKHYLQQPITTKWMRRLAVPGLALAIAGGAVVYECARPTEASAAVAEPAAQPLSPDAVNALLAVDRATEALASHVTPAVVNVTVTSRTKPDQAYSQMPEQFRRFFGGPGGFGQFFGQQMQPQPQIEHGVGSGVIIAPNGYIVTNNHVIDGAVDIRVTTSDRHIYKAKLIGADPLTDLAVLKIEATNMPSVPWGDSTQLRQGETVLAFGNPYNFRFTVTRGIVSALNRPNPDTSDRHKPGEFIQTDAAINPGNSGGPLVDARGEVVGINTFLVSPSGTFSGMGFAIPSQIAQPVVASLIKFGKVSHGYIGIGITDVTPENAKFFDASNPNGAVVTQVEPGSPGSKAGLQIGDVITEIDGRKVTSAGELQAVVGEKQPGTTLQLSVLRSGKSITVPVTLENMNKSDDESADNSGHAEGKLRWGISLGDLTPSTRQQLQTPDGMQGAVVEDVKPGSAADNAGVQRGDVILEVDRHKVESAADVKRELSNVPDGQDALLLIWSNGGNTFLVMHSPGGAS